MKLIKLTLIVSLLLSLLGCSAQSEEATPFSLDIVTQLEESGAFSEDLEGLDQEIIPLAYHLTDYGAPADAVTDCAALRSTGATCEEVALFLCQSQEDAQSVEDALSLYLQGQILANEDYRPQEIPKLESATLLQRGTSVLLAVASDSDVVDALIAD